MMCCAYDPGMAAVFASAAGDGRAPAAEWFCLVLMFLAGLWMMAAG